MTVDEWLENALRDAEKRQLPQMKPVLEVLARTTEALRAAPWNADATRTLAAPRSTADGR